MNINEDKYQKTKIESKQNAKGKKCWWSEINGPDDLEQKKIWII